MPLTRGQVRGRLQGFSCVCTVLKIIRSKQPLCRRCMFRGGTCSRPALGGHRWAGAGSVAGQACLSAQSPGPTALQSQTRSWACKHSLLCRLNEAGFRDTQDQLRHLISMPYSSHFYYFTGCGGRGQRQRIRTDRREKQRESLT